MKRKVHGLPGPRSFYRRKFPRSFPVLLTKEGHKLLNKATKRTRKSRSDVLERLVREYGRVVTFEQAAHE